MTLASTTTTTTSDALEAKRSRDSDSGHGPTSSSEGNSLEDLSHLATTSCSDDDADDESKFVDAISSFEQQDGTSEGSEHSEQDDSLKARLAETTIILRMALNNEFVKALQICAQRANDELYASLANATLNFLLAALTLEQTDLQAALSAINQSFEVSSRKKRKLPTTTLVMRFLYRPDYNTFTDEEIHAELVHAESLLLLSLISFLADQSIICFVKGAFRIRSCYQRYKECLFIMESRKAWSSEEARKHFESGVRMGYGIFNLLMSYLPRRVLRFLEYVGFSGNRSIGVEELDKSVALNDGLRSVFSTLVILTYHSYIESIFGLGHYDLKKVEQLNGALAEHYPRSAFYYLFLGRYHQMRGNLEEAIKSFESCISAQDDWKQFHSICHWEMMWCYAVQMDWIKAAFYSDLLRKHSKWSAASYTYQYGTFLYAKLLEEERAGTCAKESTDYKRRMNEIREIMEQVPKLRIRYAGKTIPAEKFAITRSIKFLKQENRLTLPALEFLYIWNIFATLKNSPNQVEQLLVRINSEIEHIKGEIDKNESENFDDLAIVLLLKGICFKHLNRLTEAEESFMLIVDGETSIRSDTFLVPHSVMELALLKLSEAQYDSSRAWIKMARNDYTGYLLETIVHFRLHAASRLIRIEQQSVDESKGDNQIS